MKPVGVILALDNMGMMLASAAKQNNSAGLEQQAKSAPANAEQAERAEPVMTRPPIWRSWGAQGCSLRNPATACRHDELLHHDQG